MGSGLSNEALGFLLVAGAGLSTGIGAAVVFSPRLIKLASRKFLAGSLGFSAGVMLYVSFVEIFNKSTGAFEQHLPGDARLPYLYATLSFFGGYIAMWLLDVLVGVIDGEPVCGYACCARGAALAAAAPSAPPEPSSNLAGDLALASVAAHTCVCGTAPAEVDAWARMADAEINGTSFPPAEPPGGKLPACEEGGGSPFGLRPRKPQIEDGDSSSAASAASATSATSAHLSAKQAAPPPAPPAPPPEDKKLVRMGINTALSIALHNFPEGLATYVATIADPAVGATLAIAIAIHNVPEGLCVSVPIYYATGSRCKAFWLGIASGLTEPLGALLGYLVLADAMSELTYGILFGMVAGMMVRISLKELLPTAHRYDPDDAVVTHSTFAGMVVMAVSLVLFVVI